jgi:hypothetical protein
MTATAPHYKFRRQIKQRQESVCDARKVEEKESRRWKVYCVGGRLGTDVWKSKRMLFDKFYSHSFYRAAAANINFIFYQQFAGALFD